MRSTARPVERLSAERMNIQDKRERFQRVREFGYGGFRVEPVSKPREYVDLHIEAFRKLA